MLLKKNNFSLIYKNKNKCITSLTLKSKIYCFSTFGDRTFNESKGVFKVNKDFEDLVTNLDIKKEVQVSNKKLYFHYTDIIDLDRYEFCE